MATLPRCRIEQGLQVFAVVEPEEAGQGERQGAEHDGRDAAFCGQRLDLALEPVAGHHGVRNGLQHLGQVAADLTLDLDGHGGPLEVLGAGPHDDSVECLRHRPPQPGLDDCSAELTCSRVRGLRGHRLDGLEQGVAGPQ